MFGFIKQMFIVLVIMFYFDRSFAIKCLSMNNQSFKVRQMLINFNPSEFHYHRFIISIDRCNESCNTAEDPFCRMCISDKLEDVNLKVFNMIKTINESKTLGKQISCECRYEFDGRKCK